MTVRYRRKVDERRRRSDERRQSVLVGFSRGKSVLVGVKASLLVIVSALFLAACAPATGTISFTGLTVRDERDGITIAGDEEKGLIAITSMSHHYGLVLPYAEDWLFTLEEGCLLKGNSGRINLTLTAERRQETPEQHLKALQKELLANPAAKGVEKADVIEYKGEPVLREIQDGAAVSGDKSFRGVKIYHFFATKRWKQDLFVLHLSKVVANGETFNEKKYLGMVTAGFSMDFMRKKEASMK